MIDTLRALFGTYEPVTYLSGSDYIVPSGFSGVNIEYVSEVALFAILMICVFKIVGVVVRHF